MPREAQPSPKERRPLSVGDAITIIALLLFAVGWVALWALAATGGDDVKNLSDGEALVLLFFVFGPPFWAGVMVEKVIDRG